MKFSKPYWVGILVALVAIELVLFMPKCAPEPIKACVLHSLTGN